MCGDGRDYRYYECDDGDTTSGDGCDASCSIELGYTCTGGTTTAADNCVEICGDGVDLMNYACDDGNLVNGDGCTSTCTIEPGWACEGGTRDFADYCYHWHNNPAITSITFPAENQIMIRFNVSITLPANW